MSPAESENQPAAADVPRPPGQAVNPADIYPSEPGTAPAAPSATVKPLDVAVSPKPKRRLPKKPLIIAAAAVLLLAGGSAAAFYGYYVPNRPASILAKSFTNTLSQRQFTTSGTLNYASGGTAAKIDYAAAVNEDTKATDVKMNMTISGVSIPLETLSAKGNFYFKVGNLSSAEGLANGLLGGDSPSLKSLENKLNKDISNQWISVDSTLTSEAKLSCLGNYPAPFAQSDIDSLKSAYQKDPFVRIIGVSSDTVNGQNAVKYDLNINDNSLSRLNLPTTGYFKSLSDCLKQISPSAKLDLSSLKDDDNTKLTVWTDKASKRIVKYSSQSSAKDKTKGVTGDVTGTISYGSVNITPPSSSKPVLNVISDLGLTDLLNGLGGAASQNPPNSPPLNILHN